MNLPLHHEYYGNTLGAYLGSAGTFILVLAAFFAGRRLIVGRLRWLAERTDTKVDDVLVDLLEMIRTPECYLLAFYAATRHLVMPGWLDRGFSAAVILAVTFRVAAMIQRAARFAVEDVLLGGRERDAGWTHTANTLGYLANFMIWAGAGVFALSNMGFNVSSMLAGLGIGGIAVALAAQAALGDLFAAVSIFLDRPFVTGDAIKAGDIEGAVEEIGFKTTRLRAPTGELLVVPNSVLATQRLQNFRHLMRRRNLVLYSAAYGTPRAVLAGLAGKIAGALEKAGEGKIAVDRVHLKTLGPFSIDFEAVYFVLSADYRVFMDCQQKAHLAVLELFEKEGVAIPFPTQTVQVAQANA